MMCCFPSLNKLLVTLRKHRTRGGAAEPGKAALLHTLPPRLRVLLCCSQALTSPASVAMPAQFLPIGCSHDHAGVPP
jgi:hypothetical protein